MSTTRRAVLASPMALAPLPAASSGAEAVAAPMAPSAAQPGACLALGREMGRLVRERNRADCEGRTIERDFLDRRISLAQDSLLRWPARDAADILAKLVPILGRMNIAEHDSESVEPVLDAADALRQCILSLSSFTGISLGELGADFIDHQLCVVVDAGEVAS
jgi:hypothetical protein